MRGWRALLVASFLVAVQVACDADGPVDRSASSPPSTVSTTGPATTSITSSTVVPTSLVYPAAINDTMEVEDGHFATVEEMAQAADLVVVGVVDGVSSLGRPAIGEDPWADEVVAVTIDVTELLKGDDVERVVLGWHAILVDPDGERVATLLTNGLRPPRMGDRMLLFLEPADASIVESLDARPTHSPVVLDGVAYLDGDVLVEGETVSTTAAQLLAMSLPEIRALVHDAAAHPRDVGEPIQPGGG